MQEIEAEIKVEAEAEAEGGSGNGNGSSEPTTNSQQAKEIRTHLSSKAHFCLFSTNRK